MKIEAKGTLTLDDSNEINRLSLITLCKWLIPPALILYYLYYKFFLLPLDCHFWGRIFFIATILALCWFYFIPRINKKLCEGDVVMKVEWSYELTDESYNASSRVGSFHFAWSDFHKWKSTKKFIILHRSEMLTEVLPKRFFKDGDFETLVEFLKTKLPQK